MAADRTDTGRDDRVTIPLAIGAAAVLLWIAAVAAAAWLTYGAEVWP